MSSRTVSVRLEANTSIYMAKMREAAAVTEQFANRIKGVDVERLGGQMQRAGGMMTAGLTLPLLALGKTAVSAAGELDSVFVRMQGLAGVAADEVDGLKSAVLDLAGETGQAPQELAEALYFIRSAGIDGQDALDALEMSARGAAVGLGESAAVADALTSAMNAYGPAALSAAEATDVLVATAREGKAEAAALAPQFGRLLPVASELGITFDEVGAGLAFLSRSSGNAELSATQLSGVMAKLLKPTEQGAEALAEVGLSVESLRRSIAEQGLLPTLEMLRERLGNNGTAKFFDDVQGLQGVLALTGQQAEEAREVFDALEDSTGALDSAFGKWAESMGAKNARAFAELQTALIQLGDVLAPIAADTAEFLAAVIEGFSSLPGPVQTVLVAFGALLAAAGPLAMIGGTILKAWGPVTSALETIGLKALYARDNLAQLTLKAGAFAIAAYTVTRAVQAWGSQMGDAASDAEDFATRFAGSFDTSKVKNMQELQDEIMRLGGAAAELQRHADNALNPFLDKRLKEARDNLNETLDPLLELEATAARLQSELGVTADEALAMAQDQDLMAAATDNATGEFDAQAAALAREQAEIDATVQAFEDLSNALRAQFDPLFGARDAMLGLQDAQSDVTEAEWAVIAAMQEANQALADHGADSDEAREAVSGLEQAERNLEDAHRANVDAALAYEGALLDLRTAVESGDVRVSDAIETLHRWADQGYITEEQARAAALEIQTMGQRAGELDGAAIDIPVKLSGFAEVIAQLDAIARRNGTSVLINASVRARERAAGMAGGGVVQGMAGGGAVAQYLAYGGSAFQAKGTDTVPAMLTPGEMQVRRPPQRRLDPEPPHKQPSEVEERQPAMAGAR